MNERVAGGVQRPIIAVRVAIPAACFQDQAGSPDRRRVMAHGAAGRVERGAEAVVDGFHFGEVVQAEPECRRLGRRDPGQRVAGL